MVCLMEQSDSDLLRRGILLIDHLADLCQVMEIAVEVPEAAKNEPHLINRTRDRLNRIINAANAIED